MGMRQRVEPTDDWQQLQLLAPFPEQRGYELLRPVVLFGQSPAARARQTGTAERTLYRQAARFEREGMASLFPPPKVEKHRTLPPRIRQAIIDLKAEHPAFSPHEIARICQVCFDRRPSPHTVKRILAETPPAPVAARRFPPYHQISDPTERRLAVIRLHSEGWAVKSIAAYLHLGRRAVYQVLHRWIAEGVAGLEDKSHARRGVRKVDLKAIVTVRELQENPRLGAFRIHAALRQLGIFLSPRTCGRILAHNRAVYGLDRPVALPHEPQPHPFLARWRHQYWTVDVRHLDMHTLDDGKIYVISILENYSRAILASALSRRQDLSAYLMVLYAAIRQHGAPEALVSDSGGIFLAKQAKQVYAALSIRKEEIARRQPWQSLIEANFGVQARMADWDFRNAKTWADLLTVHEQWVANFNYQVHWAHQRRQDGHHTPEAVLNRMSGRPFTPQALHRAFYTTRFGRTIDKLGYVRFRHWRVYGERGLTGRQVAVWLYREHLTVAFADEPLAEYRVRYAPGTSHLKAITDPHLFETPFASAQLPLLALGEEDWLKVLRVPAYAPRRPRTAGVSQPPLFSLGGA